MIILYIEKSRRAAEHQFRRILKDLVPVQAIEKINKCKREVKMKTGVSFEVVSIGDINRIRGLNIAAVFLGFEVNERDCALILSHVRLI